VVRIVIVTICLEYSIKRFLNIFIDKFNCSVTTPDEDLPPFDEVCRKYLKASTSAMTQGDKKYGEFTCQNANNYRLSLHNILYDTFYGKNSRQPFFDVHASKTSLFNIFKNQRDTFLIKCFNDCSHSLVDFEDPRFFLFLFLENCFDVSSAKSLRQLVGSYYNTLHMEDSVKYKIPHTKIMKSKVVFLESCRFIATATTVVKTETYQNFMFNLDRKLKHPDLSVSGVHNTTAFNVRIGFFSKPYFFYVVLAVLEFVGLYPSKAFDILKYEGCDREDPPHDCNALRYFTACLQSSNNKGKDTFCKGIGLSLIRCVITKDFPSTYESFKQKDLHLEVQQFFNDMFVHASTMNSFYGQLIKATTVFHPVSHASAATNASNRRVAHKRKPAADTKRASKKCNAVSKDVGEHGNDKDKGEELDEEILIRKNLTTTTVGTKQVIVSFKYCQEIQRKDFICFCDVCIKMSSVNIASATFDKAIVGIWSAGVTNIPVFCVFHATEWLVRYQAKPDCYKVTFCSTELQQRLMRMSLYVAEQGKAMKSFIYISTSIIPKKLKMYFKESLAQHDKCQCYPEINLQQPNKCLTNQSCLLRDLLVECSFYCNSGDCGNQRLKKLRNDFDRSMFCIRPVEGMGYGLFCNGVTFKHGDPVTEYVGEVIDQEQKSNVDRRLHNSYIMHSGIKGYYINSKKKGNYSRFINHSCDPNCVAEKWVVSSSSLRIYLIASLQFISLIFTFAFFVLKVDQLPSIGIFALRDIKDNEQLTMDYGWTTDDESKRTLCKCGTRICRTYMERVIAKDASSYDRVCCDDGNDERNNNNNNLGGNDDNNSHDANDEFNNNNILGGNDDNNSHDANDERNNNNNNLGGNDDNNSHANFNNSETELSTITPHANCPTEVTNIPFTTAVDKSVLTFTQPSEKGQSTYAALLSLLFRDIDKISSNSSEVECNEFLDILRASAKGQTVSWTTVMNSSLLKKEFFSRGEKKCDSVSFLSLVISNFFCDHRLDFQYSSDDKTLKMNSFNFIDFPTPKSSDFLLSNSALAFKEFTNRMAKNMKHYHITFKGTYFVAMNNRQLQDRDHKFYTGNHWGSYALTIPDEITSDRRFAVLCGFVVGTSASSLQFTYLSSFDCNGVQQWTLINGMSFSTSAAVAYS